MRLVELFPVLSKDNKIVIYKFDARRNKTNMMFKGYSIDIPMQDADSHVENIAGTENEHGECLIITLG